MKSFVVTEVAQVEALASPIRSRILELLQESGDRSVAELAQILSASAAATHYHVDVLVRVGLAVESGRRRTGPRMERTYSAVANKIRISPREDSPEFSEALLNLAKSSVRKLEKDVVSAFEEQRVEDAVRITFQKGRIRKEDLPKLLSLLSEAAALLSEQGEGPQFVLRSFLIAVPEDAKK